jgi:hypothetical protein
MLQRITLVSAFVLLGTNIWGQNTRLRDDNQIGWLSANISAPLNEKWGLQLEGHVRRADFVSQWQQGLMRVGVHYQVHPKVMVRLGMAWAETFAYGAYPLNGFGKQFSEFRAYQMLNINDLAGRLGIGHRFMLEQRFVGRYSDASLEKEDKFVFTNRLRYMLRAQLPLKGPTLDNKEFYTAFFNETMIGFGKNVNENVFDQNRLGLVVGYRMSKWLRIEAGYLNQIVQLSREITLPGESTGRNVFQLNNGLIVNSFWQIGFEKKS